MLTRTEALLEPIDRYPVVALDSHSKAGCMREVRQRADEAWAADNTLEPTKVEKVCQKGHRGCRSLRNKVWGSKEIDFRSD